MKKFADSLDTAVVTTIFVFQRKLPILHVFHHEEDGAWEFIGDDELKEDDYLVVSLEGMINLDISILEVADLEYGKEAYRDSKDSPWKIKLQYLSKPPANYIFERLIIFCIDAEAVPVLC